MDNLLFSLNVVAPLFVYMAIGYGLKSIGFIKEDFLSQLNRFVFRILLPLMLFQDIRHSYTGSFSEVNLIITALIGVTLTILISFLIVPWVVKRKGSKGSVIQGIYRSNFLIYGLPLAMGMYGEEARALISMLMVIMIPFYNVAAVIILSIFSETGASKPTVKTVLKDIVTNPLIIGCVAGLIGGAIHLELPHFVEQPFNQLAAAAAPLALFVMGGEFRFKSLKSNLTKVVVVTLLRLVFIPAIVLSICVGIGFRDVELTVLLCIFATPAAMAGYIMARNMGNDAELSAQIVVLTTACSSVTIFFFIFILRSWGYF